MPSFKTVFGSFLQQADLQGKSPKVVIESVSVDDVKDDDGSMKKKLILHFVGKDKTMILNVTNCEALSEICGTDDYDSWPGHSVVLYVDPSVMFAGKKVGGLRIRSANGVTTMPPPPPVRQPGDDDGDEVGF